MTASPSPSRPTLIAAAAVATRDAFTLGDSTLSLLAPEGAGCAWVELDVVSGRRRALASFAGDCRGGKLALSADERRGAAWFDPAARSRSSVLGPPQAFPEAPAPAGARPRLFAVELATGAATAVPVPPGLRDLGFDPRGRLIALTVQPLSEAEIERGVAVVDGAPFELAPHTAPRPGQQDEQGATNAKDANGQQGAMGEQGVEDEQGVPILAHALAFEHGAWRRIETARSTDGWDLALGVLALDAAQRLGFRSAEVLLPRVQGDDETDAAVLARLARYAPRVRPGPSGGAWIRFGAGATRFEVWEDGGDFAYSTGLAAFLENPFGEPRAPAGWPMTANDLASYTWRGDYLLAATEGIGSHPRLYRGGRPVWASDTARTVTFWPRRRQSTG